MPKHAPVQVFQFFRIPLHLSLAFCSLFMSFVVEPAFYLSECNTNWLLYNGQRFDGCFAETNISGAKMKAKNINGAKPANKEYDPIVHFMERASTSVKRLGNTPNKAPRTIIVEDKGTTEICLMDFGISTAQQKDSDYNFFRFFKSKPSNPHYSQGVNLCTRLMLSKNNHITTTAQQNCSTPTRESVSTLYPTFQCPKSPRLLGW